MEYNNQSMMVDGANPSMLWGNIADYLQRLSKSMSKTLNKRQRAGNDITWVELDNMNKELHHQLDVIIAGHKNIEENRNMNKKPIRLTEADLHRIVRESVNKVLKESVHPEYFVKCVECYTKGGQDIVFVAALSENGGDGPAKRRVMKKFPNFEIIGVSDVSGSIKIGDMSRIQHLFCNDGGVMIVDDVIQNVDDLEWYGNVDDLEFDEY